MRRRVALMLVTLGSLIVVPAALASTTITITSFNDTDFSGGTGCSGSGGSITCPSLRDAIEYADGHFSSGGATIQLKAGTYTVTNGTFGSLRLTSPNTITGTGDSGSGASIIQNSLPGAALTVEQSSGTATLSQLELTGGLYGLGVQPSADNATTDVDHVNVFGNTDTGASGSTPGVGGSEALGGGIYFAGTPGSALNLTDAFVQNNVVKGGSGASFSSGPCPSFGADDGGSAYGGGLYLSGEGKVTVAGTMITGNQVTGGNGSPSTEACPGGVGGDAVGGGISISPNPGPLSVVIQQSTIAENTASSGQDGVGGVVVGAAPTAFGGGIADGLTSGAISGPIAGVALTVESSSINDNNVIGVAEPKVGSSSQLGAPAYGGAIAAADGASVIGVNSTVFDNVASANGTPTSTSNAFGGALYAVDGTTSVDFGSTTVYDNIAQASSAAHEFGGSVVGDLDAAFTFADTVVADAGPSGVGNCTFFGGAAATDSGYNLEDDSAKSCGFTKATDKVTSAMLPSSLGDNGGPTQTLLPLAGSPVIGGGGACFDPTAANPGTPLSTDQRGEPRGSTCDIGAVQVQTTANTAAPTLSGSASVGHTLTCSRGTWSGDGLTYGYQWLRGGSAIAGAVSSTYTVQSTDLGTSISCQVTATGLAGNASATSAADSVSRPSGSIVILSGVGQLHAKWRESGKPSRRKPPVGTAFRMHLSAAATVRLTFEQTARGRRSGRKCVTATRKNHKLKGCNLTIARGTVVASERAGKDSLAFSGKPTHGGRLKPGKYEVVIQANGPNGKPSASFTLRFTIVK